MAEANAIATTGEAPKAPEIPLVKYLGEQATRQIMLIVSMAVAIALGAWLFLNFSEPAYRPLYTELSGKEMSEVVDALAASNIKYKLDNATGVIKVPASDVHQARLALAAQGLPRGSAGTGFEMLEKDQGFGTSQFIENARYHRAIEAELSRTIAELDAIRSARVHLALPKKTVFVRDQEQPSASIMVDLAYGRGLTEGQVAAIVHMAASSIPGLQHDRVTVVDQRGNLLSEQEGGMQVGNESNKQFEHRQKVEKTYVRRIESLLEAILGQGKVRAQVNADFDFSNIESTQEIYDREGSVIRSEQLIEELKDGEAGAQGIPGALSNQPPGAGATANENVTDDANANALSRNATRNYEIGKTIRHTKGQQATLKRLSVAVVLDQKETTDASGNVTRTAFAPEEIDQIKKLISDAVGLVAERGDSLEVMNAAFVAEEQPQIAPIETPIWEEAYVIEYARIGGMVLLGLLLYFLVVRPALNGMLGKTKLVKTSDQTGLATTGAAAGAAANEQGDGVDVNINTQAQGQLPGPDSKQAAFTDDMLQGSKMYESKLRAAEQVVDDEPALVANIVKNWLNEDDS